MSTPVTFLDTNLARACIERICPDQPQVAYIAFRPFSAVLLMSPALYALACERTGWTSDKLDHVLHAFAKADGIAVAGRGAR